MIKRWVVPAEACVMNTLVVNHVSLLGTHSAAHSPNARSRIHNGSMGGPSTVVPATTAMTGESFKPLICSSAKLRGQEEVPGSEVLKSTACRHPSPVPLHQHPDSCISEGLIGPVERPKSVGQLKLPIGRVVVAQRDAEVHRQTHQPANLREQQRSSGRICAEMAARTLHLLGKATSRGAVAESCTRRAHGAAHEGRPRRWWLPRSA